MKDQPDIALRSWHPHRLGFDLILVNRGPAAMNITIHHDGTYGIEFPSPLGRWNTNDHMNLGLKVAQTRNWINQFDSASGIPIEPTRGRL